MAETNKQTNTSRTTSSEGLSRQTGTQSRYRSLSSLFSFQGTCLSTYSMVAVTFFLRFLRIDPIHNHRIPMQFIGIPIKIHRQSSQLLLFQFLFLFLFWTFIFFTSFVTICVKLTITRINEFTTLRESTLLESFTRTSASIFHILKDKASFNKTGNIHKYELGETICLHEGEPLHTFCKQ